MNQLRVVRHDFPCSLNYRIATHRKQATGEEA